MKKQYLTRDKGGFYIGRPVRQPVDREVQPQEPLHHGRERLAPARRRATPRCKGKRAGRSRRHGSDSGLYRQVEPDDVPRAEEHRRHRPARRVQVTKFLDKLLPRLLRHLRARSQLHGRARRLAGLRQPPSSDQDGQNNLDKTRPRDVDSTTASSASTPPRSATPSRGTNSLYAKMFKARGSHFMGCKNEMADDPTTPGRRLDQVGAGRQEQAEDGLRRHESVFALPRAPRLRPALRAAANRSSRLSGHGAHPHRQRPGHPRRATTGWRTSNRRPDRRRWPSSSTDEWKTQGYPIRSTATSPDRPRRLGVLHPRGAAVGRW